jgi:predicted nuclease of predicted toxin-antitoxin system
MKILIDMNLSPDLVIVLENNGFGAIHWSSVGEINARDRDIMAWAKNNDYVVLTHDLDFGTILAVTQAEAPSVIQIRVQDLLSSDFQNLLISVLSFPPDALAVISLFWLGKAIINPFGASIVTLPPLAFWLAEAVI